MKKKKDSNIGIFILFLVLIGTVGFVIYYDKVINKPVVVEEKKEEITHSKEEINELYNLAKLSYEEEFAMTKSDLDLLEKGLELKSFSDELKITYGIKVLDTLKYSVEKINAPITDNEGYTYNGKYINSRQVASQMSKILGTSAYNNKTIKFADKKYVYDAGLDRYKIYEKNYKPDIEKVTYIEADWDKEHIYITEYVAYTRININPETSYTRHNNLLPINITKKNITENLDIVDKYKYTFTLNSNVNKFYLSKIEYVK